MKAILPTIDAAKSQAKGLRAALAAEGREISHAEALELIARSHGLRDWNTFHAMAGNSPRAPVQPGQRVEGHYLAQAFRGEVIGLIELSPGRYEVTLQLDQPVDVVVFDSFSNFRRRIRKLVDASGRSFDRTSDGRPHLELRV